MPFGHHHHDHHSHHSHHHGMHPHHHHHGGALLPGMRHHNPFFAPPPPRLHCHNNDVGLGLGLGLGLVAAAGAAAVASSVLAPPPPPPPRTVIVPVVPVVPVAPAPTTTVIVPPPTNNTTNNATNNTFLGTHAVNTQLGPFKLRSVATLSSTALVLGVFLNNGTFDLCLCKDDQSNNVKFFLRAAGDGSYFLLPAINPFKAVDLQNGARSAGTHAVISELSTASPSQRWRFTQSQVGQPTALLSVASGCVLECAGGSTSGGRVNPGAPLVLATVSYHAAQMFIVDQASSSTVHQQQQPAQPAQPLQPPQFTAAPPPPPPTYTPSGPILLPSANGNGAQVYTPPPPPTVPPPTYVDVAQTSVLESQPFALRSVAHTAVTVGAASNAVCAPVGCTTHPLAQRFVLRKSQRCPGWYMIEHVGSRLVLDVESCSTSNGARLVLYTPTDADNQLFTLSTHEPRVPAQLTAKHSNKVVELELATGRVLQGAPIGAQHQAWFIEV